MTGGTDRAAATHLGDWWSHRRYLSIAIGVGIALLFLVPTGLVGSSATSPPAAPSTPAIAPAPTPAPAAPATPHASGVVPGTNPSLNTPITPASIAAIHGSQYWAASIAANAKQNNSTSTAVAAEPSPISAATTPPEGWFNGTVANVSDTSDDLSGVQVQSYALATPIPCPVTGPKSCSPVTTGYQGTFNVTCEAGSDYTTFILNDFAENISYATCLTNQTVSLGLILLTEDAFAIGRVLSDESGDPAISGVTVTGCNRGCSVIEPPTVTTNTTGGFRVPLPPGTASEVTFLPPGAFPVYQTNFTYAEAASGQTVNLGTIYLEPDTLVKASLYDEVTGKPLESGFMAMEVCSMVTNACNPQGPTNEFSNTVEAYGPAGYDYVEVMAQNNWYWVVNQTPIGDVPATNHGKVWCVPNNCRIYLVPMGEVEATVSISGDWTHLFDSQNTGLYTLSISSLDGYQSALPRYNPATGTYNMSVTSTFTGTCQSVTSLGSQIAFPLRNTITVAPDTSGVCGNGIPTWPIPGDLPVWSNTTIFNATPDEVTNIGDFNLTPGVYIMGHAYSQGTDTAPTGGFTVDASSRIDPTAVTTYQWPSPPQFNFYPPAPCNQGAGDGTTFCVPAPPGPVEIKVQATGYPQNETWASVPWSTCCVKPAVTPHGRAGPLPMFNVTAPNVTSVNLSLSPAVWGTIVSAGTNLPVPYAAVSICPAASQVTGTCQVGVTNVSGGYSIPSVPEGWNYVTVVGSGVEQNGEWVNVTGPTEAATMPVYRLAALEGQVLSSGGTPVLGAQITYCLIDGSLSSQACSTQLGAGVTQSDGNYLGLVAGGALPYAVYEVEATAAGFASDWTFVNATVNETTVVPTLYLVPVGQLSNAAHDYRAAGPWASTPANTWVEGRVIDNLTGEGVVVSSLTACSVANAGTCWGFPLGSNTGGFFNQSLPTGVYNLTISASGYYTTVELLAATSTPSVNMGTITLDPLNWLWGNTTLDPWTTINVTYSDSPLRWAHILMTSDVKVEVCDTQGYCTSSEFAGTSGLFEVQSFVGFYMQITSVGFSPTGTLTGVNPATAIWNITQNMTSLPPLAWPSNSIYAVLSGTLWDNESWDSATDNYTVPAHWASVIVQTEGVNNLAVTDTSDADGNWTVLIPGGNDPGSTTILAEGAKDDLWYATQIRIDATLGPGQNLTYEAQPIGMPSWGWADVTVVNSVTGAPVPSAGVSATYNNVVTQRSGSSSDTTNTAGYLNLSAPSGLNVAFSVGGSQDYNVTSFYASVPDGGVVNLTHPKDAPNGTVALESWGWVQSAYLDYNAPPSYTGTVRDYVTGAPIPNSEVSVATADTLLGQGGSQPTNTLGEFLSDAPIGPADLLTVAHPGFVTNVTKPLNVTPDATLNYSTVNLTGYGVVAGQVLGEPGLVPVPGAQIQICPSASAFSPNCMEQLTNATGWYWTTAVPGVDTLRVTAPNYLANYTETFTLASDAWLQVPAFVLIEYGGITGVVRGLPTGLPIAGATVGACSPLGVPVGPCNVVVASSQNGSFSMAVVPGTFVLAASALDYNSTYLPVSVNPGEVVDVGSVSLTEYGVVSGTVVDSVTGLPIYNATVDACPVDTQLTCSPTTQTDTGGGYRIAADPGEVSLSFAAPSYEDTYLRVDIVSGGTITAPTVQLVPVATEESQTVSGRVVPSDDLSGGIGGAVVTFYVGGTSVFTAVTSADGEFTATVTVGSYSVVATAPGYASDTQTVRVSSTVTGLVFPLAVFGWSVSIAVVDGLTQATIPGANVTTGSTSLGTTGADGTLSTSLPNGTYPVTVAPPPALAAEYVSVSFTLEVQDGPASTSVALYPALASLSGTVGSTTGGPIDGATVTLSGTASDGAAILLTTTTNLDGQYDISAYAGTYTVAAVATGYHVASQGVSLTSGPSSASLTLTALPASVSPSTGNSMSNPSPVLVAVLGVVLGAVAVGALLAYGRSQKGKGGSP